MKRARTAIAGLLLGALALLPLPGCVGPGPNPVGSLAAVALSIGASVGTYLLIKELD
jgi:hypothetical protein